MNFILTYFDQIYGPTIYWSKEELADEVSDKIKNFIDLDLGESFFELNLVEQNLKTVNLYIEVNSEWGRGNKEMAMLTVLTDQNLKAALFQDSLKEINENMNSVDRMYKGMYINDDQRAEEEEVQQKYKELCELLDKSHADLEEMLQEANVGTLLVLGLGKVGKTTILERIRKQAFVNVRPTLTTQLFNMMIESYNFKVVDVSGQKSLRMQWWSYSKHPDAVLFVLDINDTGPRLEETKDEYIKLMARFEAEGDVQLSKKTPVIIFANKIDLAENPTVDYVKEILEVDKYEGINYSIQMVSAKTGDGIEDSFKDLVKRLMSF